MSAVVMLELDHEKVLVNAAVASKMVPVETTYCAITPGRSWTADSGGCGIEEWSECLNDREEMGKDDHLQAVGVPGRGGVREGD
jgi:hypothetical protein